MKTVSLGPSGVEVSAICLGAMYFGTRNDAASSFALLDQYVDAGGSFVDTANIYAQWLPGCPGGESEALLGQWMGERGNRSALFIATKVGAGAEPGLRAGQIDAECEKSLRRLRVDTIDLYYAHVDDRATPMDETLAAYDRLVRAGKVRFIGASNFPAWRLEEARWTSATQRWAAYCCVQHHYTYLRPAPGAADEVRSYCSARGLALLAYSPLLCGAYTRADRALPPHYVGPDSIARLAALRAVAAEQNATVNQIVLAWMLQSSPPVVPVMAASTKEQMSENLRTLEIALSPAQMERLDAASA